MSFGLDPLQQDRTDSLWTIRDTIGLILLAIGAFIGIWIFVQVMQLFRDPLTMDVFRALVSGDLLLTPARSANPGLQVPREFLSYLIVIFLLMVATGVAKAFITGGVSLLTGDLQRMIKRLTGRFEEQLSGVKDSIRRQFPQ